jgi:hypothetical protein
VSELEISIGILAVVWLAALVGAVLRIIWICIEEAMRK